MIKPFPIALAVIVLIGIGRWSAPAEAASSSEELVVKARFVLEGLKTDPNFASFRRSMKQAKGVLVVPSMLKAGFILGGRGGSGVLLARDAKGIWSYPGFFTVGGISIGLQIGVQDAEVVFVIMTDAGVNAVINAEIKLGLDASVSVGPVGAGIEGATTLAAGPDIVAYSKSVGAFAGGALEGAVIHERGKFAADYYGDANASARRIVLQGMYSNPAADALRAVLAGYN